MSVMFYHECWKSRCIVLRSEENQKDMLKNQVRLMKQQEEVEKVQGLNECVSSYHTEEENADCNELRKWIYGCRKFKRNVPKQVSNNLHSWVIQEANGRGEP